MRVQCVPGLFLGVGPRLGATLFQYFLYDHFPSFFYNIHESSRIERLPSSLYSIFAVFFAARATRVNDLIVSIRKNARISVFITEQNQNDITTLRFSSLNDR